MGDFSIHIEGIGGHQNGLAGDADQLAQDFTNALQDAGHDLRFASFFGGEGLTDLLGSDGGTPVDADPAPDADDPNAEPVDADPEPPDSDEGTLDDGR